MTDTSRAMQYLELSNGSIVELTGVHIFAAEEVSRNKDGEREFKEVHTYHHFAWTVCVRLPSGEVSVVYDEDHVLLGSRMPVRAGDFLKALLRLIESSEGKFLVIKLEHIFAQLQQEQNAAATKRMARI